MHCLYTFFPLNLLSFARYFKSLSITRYFKSPSTSCFPGISKPSTSTSDNASDCSLLLQNKTYKCSYSSTFPGHSVLLALWFHVGLSLHISKTKLWLLVGRLQKETIHLVPAPLCRSQPRLSISILKSKLLLHPYIKRNKLLPFVFLFSAQLPHANATAEHRKQPL